MSLPPQGFVLHDRKSPLTAPWEPIYAHKDAARLSLGLWVDEPHTNSRGLAHGGLITALADNAMGLTCGLHIAAADGLVTASLNVDFLGSARIGQWLEIRPEHLKAGRTLSFAQCLITADDKPCARANASFAILRREA